MAANYFKLLDENYLQRGAENLHRRIFEGRTFTKKKPDPNLTGCLITADLKGISIIYIFCME